ncbi:hypothetical protein HYH02_004280 [Chlamydomonas schloesseri]|uniref:Uncharacterized protein n=1 Tax=Chlamydomonas schloesseri TaxID=2026947 RepID=A0A836B919_9CHLO|nr:hypothetical protein HYH02_004280 [Chlamydomonas schloesseri]|eukprot:KAG2451010.1 hypothetical protein HYH02_004280 [Chlamydomonas schloesseri]
MLVVGQGPFRGITWNPSAPVPDPSQPYTMLLLSEFTSSAPFVVPAGASLELRDVSLLLPPPPSAAASASSLLSHVFSLGSGAQLTLQRVRLFTASCSNLYDFTTALCNPSTWSYNPDLQVLDSEVMYGTGIMGVGALNGGGSAGPFAALSDTNFTCSGGGPVTCSATVVSDAASLRGVAALFMNTTKDTVLLSLAANVSLSQAGGPDATWRQLAVRSGVTLGLYGNKARRTSLDFANTEGGISLNAFSGARLFLSDLELLGLPYPARVLRPAHFVAAFGHGVYVNTTRDAASGPSSTTRFPPALNIAGCTLVLPDAEVAWWRYVSSDIADAAAIPDNWGVRRHTLPPPSASHARLAVLVDVAGGPRISLANVLLQGAKAYSGGALSPAAAAAAAGWPLAAGLDAAAASTTIKLGSVAFLNTIAPAADIEFCDNGRTLLVPTDPASPPTAPGFLQPAALAAGYGSSGSGGSTAAVGVLAVEQGGLDELYYMMEERVNCTLAAPPYVQARRRTFYDLKAEVDLLTRMLSRAGKLPAAASSSSSSSQLTGHRHRALLQGADGSDAPAALNTSAIPRSVLLSCPLAQLATFAADSQVAAASPTAIVYNTVRHLGWYGSNVTITSVLPADAPSRLYAGTSRASDPLFEAACPPAPQDEDAPPPPRRRPPPSSLLGEGVYDGGSGGGGGSSGSNDLAWILPIAICVPVVLLAIFGFIFVRRRRAAAAAEAERQREALKEAGMLGLGYRSYVKSTTAGSAPYGHEEGVPYEHMPPRGGARGGGRGGAASLSVAGPYGHPTSAQRSHQSAMGAMGGYAPGGSMLYAPRGGGGGGRRGHPHAGGSQTVPSTPAGGATAMAAAGGSSLLLQAHVDARAAEPKPTGRMASLTAALMSITHRGQSAAHPNAQRPKTPRTPRTPHTPHTPGGGGGGGRSAPWRTSTNEQMENDRPSPTRPSPGKRLGMLFGRGSGGGAEGAAGPVSAQGPGDGGSGGGAPPHHGSVPQSPAALTRGGGSGGDNVFAAAAVAAAASGAAASVAARAAAAAASGGGGNQDRISPSYPRMGSGGYKSYSGVPELALPPPEERGSGASAAGGLPTVSGGVATISGGAVSAASPSGFAAAGGARASDSGPPHGARSSPTFATAAGRQSLAAAAASAAALAAQQMRPAAAPAAAGGGDTARLGVGLGLAARESTAIDADDVELDVSYNAGAGQYYQATSHGDGGAAATAAAAAAPPPPPQLPPKSHIEMTSAMRTAASAAGVVSGVASPSLLPPDAVTGAAGRGASPARGASPSRWQQPPAASPGDGGAAQSPGGRSGLVGMQTAPRAPAVVIPPPRLSGSGSAAAAAAFMAAGGGGGAGSSSGLPQSPSLLSGMRRAGTPSRSARSPRVSGSGEPVGSGDGGGAPVAAAAAAAAAAAPSPRGSQSGTGVGGA